MKILFLDNDGVVCLTQQWGGRAKKIKKWKMFNDGNPPVNVRMDSFDPKAVKVLNEVLEKTGAEIVVSSDWKLYCTLDELKQMFTDYGVIKQPIDCTPNHVLTAVEKNADVRVEEIKEWLTTHPEVTAWVAVDDLDLSKLDNFVHTKKMNEGIKQNGIKDKLIKILNK